MPRIFICYSVDLKTQNHQQAINVYSTSNPKESSVKWRDGRTVTQIIEPDSNQQHNNTHHHHEDREETLEDSVPASSFNKKKNASSRSPGRSRGGSPGRRGGRGHPEDDETFYSGDETYISEETEETRRRARAHRNRRKDRRYANETFLNHPLQPYIKPEIGVTNINNTSNTSNT